MAIEVEVLKVDYPGGEDDFNVTCKVEKSEEILYDSSTVSLNRLPVFTFNVTKSIFHRTTLEFYIAARKSRDACCCTFPLNLISPSKNPPETLVPSDMVHMVHLVTPIPDSAMEKVVAKVWFKVRELMQRPQPTTILQSTFSAKNANINLLFSKERSTVCDFEYTVKSHPTIFVVFHSVTGLKPNISSKNITPIALLDTLPAADVTSLFDKEEGNICTFPVFRAVALRCKGDHQVLQLHIITEEEATPLFSVTIQISILQPFRTYNVKYNQKLTKNSSPKHSQGNVEPNVKVSLLYWPPSANFSSYEGLEIFVEQLHLEHRHKEENIVLCCKLVSGERETSRTYSESANGANWSGLQTGRRGSGVADDEDSMVAVMQSFDSGLLISTPAYFFFPSCPQLHISGDFKFALDFYASGHNTELWCGSSSMISVKLEFSDSLRRAMMLPENEGGIRLKLLGDRISNDEALYRKVNVIVRWKKAQMEFLSVSEKMNVEPSLMKREELPLDETSILHFQSLVSPTHPGSPTISIESGISKDSFTEAVAKMGSDILQLRKKNEMLERENRNYEKYILGMEASVVVTATKRQSLLLLTKHDLIDKIVNISESLIFETETRKSFQSKISALQNTLIKKNDVESCYIELREAHAAQQRLVWELQGKIVKYRKCMLTCKQQESIINNLESLLSEKTRDFRAKESMGALSKENARLRAALNDYQTPTGKEWLLDEKDKAIRTLQKELSKLSKRCHELENTTRAGLTMESSGTVRRTAKKDERIKVDELKQKLEVAEVHDRSVMQELTCNARRRAREKAKYEPRLAELRPESRDQFLRTDLHVQPRHTRERSRDNITQSTSTHSHDH